MNDAQAQLLKALALTGGATGLIGALAGWRTASEDPDKLEELSTTSPEVTTIPMPKKKPMLQLGLKTASLGGWLVGENAKSILDIPITPTALMGTGLGSLALANGLTQKIIIANRRAKLRKQVADAEKDYTDTMLNAYPASKVAEIDKDLEKLASILKVSEKPIMVNTAPAPSGASRIVSGIGGAASALFSNPDKLLQTGGTAGNIMAGLGILGAVGLPALSARIAYSYFRDRSKNKMLDEAARFRQYSRLQNSTPEIYVKAGE